MLALALNYVPWWFCFVPNAAYSVYKKVVQGLGEKCHQYADGA